PTALDTIPCCGQEQPGEERIEAAVRWLADNFAVQTNPGDFRAYHLYYLYALERVGRLTGRRFIGDADWYREGSHVLVALQDRVTGRIIGQGTYAGTVYTETAFALLFLSKGKRQTVVSRLKHGPG